MQLRNPHMPRNRTEFALSLLILSGFAIAGWALGGIHPGVGPF
jgi:hypothetical protein